MPITQVPGPAGADGTDGTDGTDGVDAFTFTTAQFTQPAINSNVTVDVIDSTWMAIGQVLYVQNAGYYTVQSKPTVTSVSLKNLGYTGNVAPTTIVASGQEVSPAGIKGDTGAAGATPTFNSLSPTTTKGDIIVDNGANNPLASDVRLAAGSNGQILTAKSTQATGLQWQTLLPYASATTDNVIPRFDTAAATEIPAPVQTSGLLISDTGALQSTPTGGNARGASAIDLQPVRGAVTQVASGANATIAGGLNNTGSGARSAIGGGTTNIASGAAATVGGGNTNTASDVEATVGGGANNVASGADSTVAGGTTNVATGVSSAIGGGGSNTTAGLNATVPGGSANSASASYSFATGRDNIASGTNASVPGGFRATAYLTGQEATANGRFAINADAQSSRLIWRIGTTDATANVEMFLDGGSARAVIPSETTWAFFIMGVARRDTGTSISFEVKGAIQNNAGSVSLVAAVVASVVADGTGTALTIANFVVDADDPNNALRIRVTGIIAQNWRWVAHARLVEVAWPS